MDSVLTIEPVSSAVPAFREMVTCALTNHETLVLLLRHANHGGAKDYFIARTSAEFEVALAHSRSKTSITVFFNNNFVIWGVADDELCRRTVELFTDVYSQYDGVDLIRTDGKTAELDSEHFVFATTPDEIGVWFQKNNGSLVLIGTMEFWNDNSPKMVTVYVPDKDGVVRPGAY